MIIVRQLLHLPLAHTLAYDAVLQFAAAIALTIYFWRDILHLIQSFFLLISGKVIVEKEKTLLWAIILGTIPAIIFGLLLQSYMDSIFRNIKLVGLTLLLGSGLMYYAQRKSEHKHEDDKPMSVKRGIIIGFYQCLALVPGVSRSGATISGGLLSGLSRDETVRFSFLLSVPILLGSGLKELISVRHDLAGTSMMPLFLGSLASFVVALFAIHYFIRFLKNHNLNIFIWYRIALFFAIFLIF
jgi:undecaprenyl-diphosphatase